MFLTLDTYSFKHSLHLSVSLKQSSLLLMRSPLTSHKQQINKNIRADRIFCKKCSQSSKNICLDLSKVIFANSPSLVVLQICKARILLIGCRRECCVFGFAKILAHIRSTENATPFSCNYTQQTEEKSYLIECLESISICFRTKDKTALVKNVITRSDILQGQKQQLP